MPLASDYFETPDKMAAAELVIRGAIRDSFLVVATAYLFDSNHAHLSPRFVETDADFESIAMVEDPDTAANGPSGEHRKIVRYCHVLYAGHRAGLYELTINYEIDVSLGFKDEYASTPGLRSYDELTALNFKFEKYLRDNQNLGLDDRVSHGFLQTPAKPVWTPVDNQGSTTVTLTHSLAVTLKVC
jgi:hypothetical protein